MRLANIRSGGTTRAARVDGDTLVVFEDELTGLLRRPGWLDIARTSGGERVPAEGVCFAPLVTKPDKIICAGLNYKGHIAETGRPTPERGAARAGTASSPRTRRPSAPPASPGYGSRPRRTRSPRRATSRAAGTS